MEDEKQRFLRKLCQMEEHARALTQDLTPGEAQDRARVLWGLVAHLVVTVEIEQAHPAAALTR